MRRTRCWTLAFLVVLGLAVPMCAQSADPVDDPLALYTKKQVQYGMNQYCWWIGLLGPDPASSQIWNRARRLG